MTPRLWLGAAVEIAVAAAVALFVLRNGNPMAMHHHHAAVRWPAPVLLLIALTVAAAAWWLATRVRQAAAVTAVGLVAVTASAPVRALATGSHLVAMAALEVLLVAVPLLVISATRRRIPALGSAAVMVATVGYSALLIALHLPSVHDSGAHAGAAPVWLAGVAVAVGIAYWASILMTAGDVATSIRRRALMIGQEVAAILGIAAMIRPGSLDARLGGALMLATCAAVTLPLLKKIERTEADAH